MRWVKESAPVQRRAAAAFLLLHSLPNEGAKRRQPSGSRTDPRKARIYHPRDTSAIKLVKWQGSLVTEPRFAA